MDLSIIFVVINNSKMDFSRLPKIELHLHLDCSLSYEVVKVLNPAVTLKEYRRSFVGPPKCLDLADFITRAIKGIELMQTERQLRLVTLDLFEQLKADHVIYAEIRFAPLEHLEKGLSPQQVVETVDQAMKEGMKKTGVQAGLILCTLRHYSEEQSMETVKLVEQFLETTVVGFDIAADEAGFPIDNHIKAFQYANQKGIQCTAHAGEACGAESVWETLNHFHPSRIGHGVRSTEDPNLMTFLKQQNIHLEVCPTSNIQTNVYHEMKDHTVDKIYRSGVSMSINTDARTICDVTLANEYQTLMDRFNWEKAHFLQCNLHAVEACFASEKLKASLKQQIIKGFS